jgi:NitT/TauT family transport system permease protein
VSEVITYKGQDFVAHGLGADISRAASHGDFPALSACLVVMVVVVVILNRTFWSRIYRITQTRYRLDL